MKKLCLFLFGMLLSFSFAYGAQMLPPKYLSIPDFQKCLATKNMGTWQSWCMPAKKPSVCAEQSWQQLNSLTGKDRVPDC